MSLGKREKSNLFLFEEKFGIDCQNVCGNLQKFSQGLNNLFGEGAKVIEGLILQALFRKTGYKPEDNWKQIDFEDNIRKVKEYLEKAKDFQV